MGLQLPFRRIERFPALRQAQQMAEAQAQQLVAVVEQHLPRRRVSFWARPLGMAMIALAVAGTAIAALATVFLRQRDSADDNRPELGLSTTHTEVYDANRAADANEKNSDGVDAVHEAAQESFPASDAPVFVNGPDVPIIRHGERKEELPYQQS